MTRLSPGIFGRLFSSGTSRLCAADAVQVEDDTLKHLLGGQLSDIKAAGTFKQEFEITTPQGPAIRMYLSLETCRDGNFTHIPVDDFDANFACFQGWMALKGKL